MKAYVKLCEQKHLAWIFTKKKNLTSEIDRKIKINKVKS